MKIIAGEYTIFTTGPRASTIYRNGVKCPTLHIPLTEAVTDAQLAALAGGRIVLQDDDGTPIEGGVYEGYSTLITHEAVIAKVQSALEQLAEAQAEIEEKDGEISTLRERFDELKNTGSWAELENGAQIAVGTRVRYLLRTYECIQAHDKSLLKSPTNNGYWRETED